MLPLIALLASVSVAGSAEGWAPSPGALDDAWDYSVAHCGYSLLVIQHGHTVLERYAQGDGPGARHKIYSGTKGLW